MVLDGEPEVHEAAFRELTAFVYCEPSNKNWDAQSEKVLQTALAASLAHYLALGNIDIDHLSLLGPRHGLTPAEAKLYEIGVPAQVLTAPKILVKAEIYRGTGKQGEQANYSRDTLTKHSPPKRWYPSVGGWPTAPKECRPQGCVVKSVLWTNLAFAKEPVNQTVKAREPQGRWLRTERSGMHPQLLQATSLPVPASRECRCFRCRTCTTIRAIGSPRRVEMWRGGVG